jgi:hypothetical protein
MGGFVSFLTEFVALVPIMTVLRISVTPHTLLLRALFRWLMKKFLDGFSEAVLRQAHPHFVDSGLS